MYLDELEGDYNLICDLPLLFPQKKLPSNYHFIGPLYYVSASHEHEVLRFLDNGKPSILVSLGSSGDFSKLTFLKDQRFKKFNIVVAGDRAGIFKEKHILSRPFLNNSAFMARIDLVLTHGGNGSIYQALAFGVPLICRPGIFEQEWNVQALTRLNLGTTLADDADIDTIERLIHDWISKRNTPDFETVKDQVNIAETRRRFAEVWRMLRI
jgi:UDP:flavonoid glycosyltransferase YjiC (YdhE family)